MRILITGGAGFLGRNLANYFSNRGHQVYGCGRGELTEMQQSVMGFTGWCGGSISPDLLNKINFEPDIVIHCAGNGLVDASLQNPRDDYLNSVQSTEIVLEHIRRYFPHVKFIFPSSPAVVGSVSNHPISILKMPFPLSTYGHGKLIVENICENYIHNYNIDIVIIRLFSLYGIGLKKQLLWDACNKFSRGGTAEFWGDGNETRDFVNIEDVAELFYLVANNKSKLLPKKMNCGSGKAYKVRDILVTLQKDFQDAGDLAFSNKIHKGHPRHYWSDNFESNQFGWHPKVKIEEALHSYSDWFKSLQ